MGEREPGRPSRGGDGLVAFCTALGDAAVEEAEAAGAALWISRNSCFTGTAGAAARRSRVVSRGRRPGGAGSRWPGGRCGSGPRPGRGARPGRGRRRRGPGVRRCVRRCRHRSDGRVAAAVFEREVLDAEDARHPHHGQERAGHKPQGGRAGCRRSQDTGEAGAGPVSGPRPDDLSRDRAARDRLTVIRWGYRRRPADVKRLLTSTQGGELLHAASYQGGGAGPECAASGVRTWLRCPAVPGPVSRWSWRCGRLRCPVSQSAQPPQPPYSRELTALS